MATNYINATILHNSKRIAANDWSIHNNERNKCGNIYQPTQLIPSLPDSSENWKNSKNHSSQDTFEPAKVAAENDRRAFGATILLEIDRKMKKYMDNLHHVLEDVSAQLTQLETRIHHLQSSMNDLKVSVRNNHGITDGKLTLFENILREIQVQNVKEKQDIVQAELQPTKQQVSKTTDQQPETQTSVMSNPVQQASSVSASAPLQSQQYLPQSIHVVSPPNAPPQHGLPPPIQLPDQFPQIPNPTVPRRDPYLPPPGHSQEIPNKQYQLHLTQQPCPQPGAQPHQQYQQTPHSQYSQPPPHLYQQQLPHSSANPPQLKSSMGHRLEKPPYAPSQNYPLNLRHPPSQPHSRLQPPQQFYGTPPQGYEPPSSRFGASYSSRYDTLSEIAEPNRYGRPPKYGGKQLQFPIALAASSGGSGYPQLPTARVLRNYEEGGRIIHTRSIEDHHKGCVGSLV